MQKSTDSDDLSDEGELTVKMESEMSPQYSIQDDQDGDDGENDSAHAQVYERQSKRMRDKHSAKETTKGKKRRRDEDKVGSSREELLHQQVDEYSNSATSAVVTNTPADSTQAVAAASENIAPTAQAMAANLQGAQQPQQHMQQYYHHMTDEMRDSLDLLSEPKNEFYGNEYNSGEYNEAKPLADLLMNPTIVSYSQEGNSFSQAQPIFSTSQMIAQAYSHAQQMGSAPIFSQVVSSTNTYPQSVPTQVAGNMNVTVVSSHQGQEVTTNQNNQQQQQQQTQTIDVNGQQVQAQVVGQAQMTAQQVQNYADAYAAQVSADSVVQQQQGQVVTFSLAGGQNMIIASPHAQHAGQNYVIQSHGAQHGQNILIAAPGQQTMSGNFIVKTEGDDMGHNLVLTQQNLQQALGQNMLLTQDGQLTTAGGGDSVVLTSADGQQRHHIQTTRQIQPAPHPQQQMIAQGIPIQAGGGQMPQVSLVLPQVNSLFPQIQTSAASINPQAFLQVCAMMDKTMAVVKESHSVLLELNKRVERIENHPFLQSVALAAAAQSKIVKPKPKPNVPGSSTPSPATPTSANSMVTKANLKAALSSYLTISDYTATDELKRSDSNSDLFIPVGTVSMLQGQGMLEAPSPSETPETASSTVQEHDQDLLPIVLSGMGNGVTAGVPTSDINVPIVDSQSGIAVTLFDEGNENQKFALGPGSGKEPNARFSNTSATPKTVILDPRFWEILVEDFQKNMNSDQLISAMSSTRKPLVRSIGTSEISICSTVLKEAESACQGRRERLAKELVFRIFTLGEVYDRNVSGVFYINGKKMENKNKALDPAKMAAIHYLVMKYPPSVVDNPRLERLVWKNCVDRINDALRRIYNWIHKIVDVTNIMEKLPTESIMMH
ncbi:unnamed protein product [Candidula unifasciata]|uniref:BEN domain-containing protein n=1 Tax=Candidula unifasciata TaxID=100452 RepID=A0A8S3ZWR9_9EUPU|nr:unnamed protein product [Candidula unifasciata]